MIQIGLIIKDISCDVSKNSIMELHVLRKIYIITIEYLN